MSEDKVSTKLVCAECYTEVQCSYDRCQKTVIAGALCCRPSREGRKLGVPTKCRVRMFVDLAKTVYLKPVCKKCWEDSYCCPTKREVALWARLGPIKEKPDLLEPHNMPPFAIGKRSDFKPYDTTSEPSFQPSDTPFSGSSDSETLKSSTDAESADGASALGAAAPVKDPNVVTLWVSHQ